MLSIAMSKKTLALIAGLTVLTLVLVVLALNTNPNTAPVTQQTETRVTTTEKPTPTVPAYTVVNLSPDPVPLRGGVATVEVGIDTGANQVTGVQFEVTYDPAVLNFGTIRQGTFFDNTLILINQADRTNGRVTYAIGLTPAGSQNPKSGTGTVATLTFTRKSTAPATGTTPLGLENVMVSAKGLAPSVLKEATGTVVSLSNSPVTTTTTASPSGR